MFLDLGAVPPLYAFWYCILHAVDSSQIHSTKSTKQVTIGSFLTQLHPMNFVPSFFPNTRVLSPFLNDNWKLLLPSMERQHTWYNIWCSIFTDVRFLILSIPPWYHNCWLAILLISHLFLASEVWISFHVNQWSNNFLERYWTPENQAQNRGSHRACLVTRQHQ